MDSVVKSALFRLPSVFGAVLKRLLQRGGQLFVGCTLSDEISYVENAGIVQACFEYALWRYANAVAAATKGT